MSLGEVEVVPAAAREVLLETTAAPPQAVGVAPLQTVILATAMAFVQVAAMEAVEEVLADVTRGTDVKDADVSPAAWHPRGDPRRLRIR